MKDKELRRYAKLAKGGDQLAYVTLLRESAKILRTYYLRKGFTTDAEDIVQEALIGVHRSLKTYDSERAFGPWLFAVGNYKMASYLRKAGRHQKNVTYDQYVLESIEEQSLPRRKLELDDDLQRALEELPRKQRIALESLKLKDMTVKEAAAATGMSESAVKVNAHRAYKTLKHKLERIGYEY